MEIIPSVFYWSFKRVSSWKLDQEDKDKVNDAIILSLIAFLFFSRRLNEQLFSSVDLVRLL